MHVKQSIKTNEGIFHFEGILSSQELTLVVETGLNTLFEAGMLPFRTVNNNEDLVKMTEGSTNKQ